MKKIYTLFVFTLMISLPLLAQIEQVSVGAGYSHQAYYSLSDGTSTIVDNKAWDISFSDLGAQDAGVFINESSSATSSPIQLYLSSTTDWEEPITNVDSFTDDNTLQNPEENWSEGAFNSIKDPNSPFDYGWGVYNPTTHTIDGTKIFIIKKREGTFIKVQIQSLSNVTYTIRWASLDGTNQKTSEISKTESSNGMIYFSFDSEDIVDMPTDYDLIFQRYTTPLDAGDGTFIDYIVTGVLLANGTEAVLVDDVDPTAIDYTDYTDQFTSHPTTIGHTWKYFDFTSGWIIDNDRTHIVKNKEGNIYKLTFFDFEGSSTGTTTLERVFQSTVSAKEVEAQELDLIVYPNPTTEFFTVQSQDINTMKVMLTDINGQIIRQLKTTPNEIISLNNIPAGIYTVKIVTEKNSKAVKLVVE